MFDSHCHLYFPEFDQDRVETIERARKTGVFFFVQVGASLEDSRKALELAAQYDDMAASVGIHPHCAESAEIGAEIAELRKIVIENKNKVAAIGECGLDFGKSGEIEDNEKKAQTALFEAQIILAQELKLPLIIHCRNTHRETAQKIQDARSKLQAVIIHCFTGNWEDAKQYLDLGCFISFSGIVSFKKKAEAIQEAAVKTPLDRLLIETDAPYLAPEPFRGKRNEPAFIKNIIQSIADLRGVSFDKIEKTTDQNAEKIFTPTPNKLI
ncbi:MAG: Hydrolase, TatD family [candidate division CPR1 bacterium GW2011_GWA2_42_17]|uniref:Hydrolase, TatD family n=1 Tax=candidate division CPR1 bacterium GW2011_GWA2_42_17 TaxID=1618341 RepID=A0A0G0YZL0_9BACT|nr:MAG: Hydrolase, TatD family [candidate division CPR1 bacterium GW2011_GWA2_42_17]